VRFVVIVGREVTRPAPRAAVTAADESQIRILSLLDIYAVRSKREREMRTRCSTGMSKLGSQMHPSNQGARMC
jgi:hypothetical protein